MVTNMKLVLEDPLETVTNLLEFETIDIESNLNYGSIAGLHLSTNKGERRSTSNVRYDLSQHLSTTQKISGELEKIISVQQRRQRK